MKFRNLNITARRMVEYILHDKTITDEEWLEIRDEVKAFLKSNPSEEERKLFVPLGCMEIVTMMCDGIEEKHE